MPISTKQLADAIYNWVVDRDLKTAEYNARAEEAALNMCYQAYIQDYAANHGTLGANLDIAMRDVLSRLGEPDPEFDAYILKLIQLIVTVLATVRATVNDDNVVTFTAACQRLVAQGKTEPTRPSAVRW